MSYTSDWDRWAQQAKRADLRSQLCCEGTACNNKAAFELLIRWTWPNSDTSGLVVRKYCSPCTTKAHDREQSKVERVRPIT